MSDRSSLSTVQWKWVLASMGIFFVVQLVLNMAFVVFGLLTFGFGFLLFAIVKPITYFVGGLVTGRLSPGVTITEPAIGAVAITVLGTIFDATQVARGRVGWMILSSFIAFLLAMWGARVGERAS
jgi:hypothetical protein